MICDLQKASLLRRFSAFLLDFILVCIIAVGAAALFSLILHFDKTYDIYESRYETVFSESDAKIRNELGIDFDLTQGTDNFTPEQKAKYDEYLVKLGEALNKDEQLVVAYNNVIILTLTIIPLALFVAFVLLEFVMPLILKNGQTVGKKIFGIGVIQTNGVRLKTFSLFVRGVVGKYTIETMVPVFLLLMMFFRGGIVGIVVIGLILILQLVLLFKTKTRSFIHDVISYSCEVDLSSQMIFDTEDDRLRYITENHAQSQAVMFTQKTTQDDDDLGEIR